MIVGHYTASFVAKAVRPGIPLWHLIIAAQLIDFAWGLFILTNLELGKIQEGFTVEFPFDFYYMPFSHSLPALAFWSVATWGVYLLCVKSARKTDALVVAAVVASHWFFDLLVHPADLQIVPGFKVGFGLWNYPFQSVLLELGMLMISIIWYTHRVRATRYEAHHLESLLILAVLSIHFFFYFQLNPSSIKVVAATVLGSYSVVAWLAWKFEKIRTS